eukprot:757202-Hanusia_phi.AAC.3
MQGGGEGEGSGERNKSIRDGCAWMCCAGAATGSMLRRLRSMHYHSHRGRKGGSGPASGVGVVQSI